MKRHNLRKKCTNSQIWYLPGIYLQCNTFFTSSWKAVIPAHATRAHRGSGGQASLILDLNTLWSWFFSLTHRPLYLGERTPNARGTVGWMGPRGGLDVLKKGSIYCQCLDSKLSHCTEYIIHVPYIFLKVWQTVIEGIQRNCISFSRYVLLDASEVLKSF